MPAKFKTDVLVVGGGMAGLTTASAAARAGARVVLVERASQLGGSAALSGGFLWTVPTTQTLLQRDPCADPTLCGLVVDSFADCLAYVDSLGVEALEEVTIQGWGRGHQIDVASYINRCRAIVEAAGGWIVLDADTEHLVRQPKHGRVAGALVHDLEATVEVAAQWTVLATGGFQGDAQVRATMIGPSARNMLLRSNAHSRGDGLRLAQEVGAATRGGTGFYGHLICRPIARFDPPQFIRCAQYHSEHSLVLNLKGERFTDESQGDHIINQDLLCQPQARGLLIADSTVWTSWASAPAEEGMEGTDRYEVAREMGANVAAAETLTSLVEQVTMWGYPARAVSEAISTHNATCVDNHRPSITVPPFKAVEVQPSVTFPFAGIAVDREMQVLDEHGQPIGGLLSAGVDIGGVYSRYYAGGLALAVASGLHAARKSTRNFTTDSPTLSGH